MPDRGKSQLSLILDQYNFKNYINTVGREELLNSSITSQQGFLEKGLGEIADALFSVSNSPLYTNEFIRKFDVGNNDAKNIGKSIQVTFENFNGADITPISDAAIRVQPASLDIRLFNLDKDSFRLLLREPINNTPAAKTCNIQGYNPEKTSATSSIQAFSLKEVITGANINENPARKPTKSKPHLSTFQIFDESLAIGNRQTTELSTFLNTVPTLEFSRAVPLIAAKFSLPAKISSAEGNSVREFAVANNADFLFGSENEDAKAGMDIFRGDMFQKSIKNNAGETSFKQGISTNLDIFLSPQTMVNTEEKFSGADSDYSEFNRNRAGRSNPVIDKMRPFMSITSFNIDVRPTRGLMSYKTAQLELVLHDRSRMADVAPFIKPDLFGTFGSEISIEYGWAHPDGSNPYGAMLNLLRAKEKYMIVNSTFSLQQTGEVNISLSLAMLGATDIINRNVFSSDVLQNQLREYEKLIADFKDFNESNIQSGDFSNNKYKSLASDIASNTPSGEAYKKKLREIIKSPNIEGANDNLLRDRAKTILDSLNEIDKAKGTIFQDVKKTIDKKIDPYMSFDIMRKLDLVDKDGKIIDKSNSSKSKSIEDYTSFGKVVLSILSKELISTQRFNEIQVIFYNSNITSSKASSVNLANLPIRKKYLHDYIKDVIQKNLKQLSFGGLLQAVSKRFIENKASLIYGFKGIFVYDIETGNTKVPDNITTADAIASQKQILYKTYYDDYNVLENALKRRESDPDATFSEAETRALTRKVDFKPIKIGFSTEVIYKSDYKRVNNLEVSPEPMFSFKTENKDSDTILRVHVFDKANTPFQGAYDFINTEIKNDLETINTEMLVHRKDLANRSAEDYAKSFNNALAKNLSQLKADINFATEDTTDIVIKTKFGTIKETYKKIMPSLTYGSQNSAIINASFQTINEGRLSTVFITRADREVETRRADTSGTTTVGAEDLPLRVLPAKVELTTIGCPIINFAQSLFFDFNTGTTVDNLYNVVGIKHSIASGKFESSMTLQYGDVYGKFESRIVSDLVLEKTVQRIAQNARDDEKRRAEERRARRIDAANAGRRSRTFVPEFFTVNLYTV